MHVAVLGTGDVGRRLATKLVDLGHEVTMGARSSLNEAARAWSAETGGSAASFEVAAAHGDLIINATNGLNSIDALSAAGAQNLAGKVLLDVSNPLDFSHGFPPQVPTFDGRSLGELIQDTFPDAKVVKALNTMTNAVMVDPHLVPGDHTVFASGNDQDAKISVFALLHQFGWRDRQILDLGDISTALGTEAYMALWTRIYAATGSGILNIAIHRPD